MIEISDFVPVPIEPDADISEQVRDLIAHANKSAAPEAKAPSATSNSEAKKVANGPGPGGPGPGGPGPGGPIGVPNALTKQQVYAQRWRFDLAGGPKEHAAKLTAVGVTLGYFERNTSIALWWCRI